MVMYISLNIGYACIPFCASQLNAIVMLFRAGITAARDIQVNQREYEGVNEKAHAVHDEKVSNMVHAIVVHEIDFFVSPGHKYKPSRHKQERRKVSESKASSSLSITLCKNAGCFRKSTLAAATVLVGAFWGEFRRQETHFDYASSTR